MHVSYPMWKEHGMRISQKKRHFHSCLDISLVHNLEANTANDSSEQNTPLILGLQ